MNAITKNEQRAPLLTYMSERFGLTEQEFAKTVRATCGLANATNEQFAAFLIVAREYQLNPLTKEVYAFPGKGGGIVPVVSIDGWVNLVNSHPQCDGFEFDAEHDGGKLISITCRMHRKDRSHPVVVTEYLSECKRPTDPWKMEHRMLRHKAMIQAARYAFGFAGIYDPDEGQVISEAAGHQPMQHVQPVNTRAAVPSIAQATAREAKVIEQKPAKKDDPISSGKTSTMPDFDGPNIVEAYDEWLTWVSTQLDSVTSADDLETFWDRQVAPREKEVMPPDFGDLLSSHRKAEQRVSP